MFLPRPSLPNKHSSEKRKGRKVPSLPSLPSYFCRSDVGKWASFIGRALLSRSPTLSSSSPLPWRREGKGRKRVYFFRLFLTRTFLRKDNENLPFFVLAQLLISQMTSFLFVHIPLKGRIIAVLENTGILCLPNLAISYARGRERKKANWEEGEIGKSPPDVGSPTSGTKRERTELSLSLSLSLSSHSPLHSKLPSPPSPV